MFVFRLNKDTREDEVTDYLSSKNILVNNIESTSHENAMFKSFRVNLNYSDFDKVMDSNLWPPDVGCRRYTRPRRQMENSLTSRNGEP
jgi:hypothetical protein